MEEENPVETPQTPISPEAKELAAFYRAKLATLDKDLVDAGLPADCTGAVLIRDTLLWAAALLEMGLVDAVQASDGVARKLLN